MKFLIDECLTPRLEILAQQAGYFESAHVRHRGMLGWKDSELMNVIIADDWTLVTRNADDFRPRPGSSSKAPCYVGHPLHAGLVCLNLPTDYGRKDQMQYFEKALQYMEMTKDLVNQILEVDPDNQNPGQVKLRKDDFP